ncbi:MULTISPECIES: GNAT family N-acetyltransferase [unclassified Rhizobium]|uniref:GNAT family N-acetyltransferase n=1 Tax=unclassified Rhizobium TaxID=2613769 RepID=UPI001ADD5641|nr:MULTISPECIES: GNAT family N-acetyltransferase [unclassified Rhizobium]MBO9099073.1 GNAT family N-acetyltransferase [Rhizobium sp. L58/93]MBO9132120.1 GNAT family N-acetyltransferase [Rhizobium sp. B209b/85]MBO9169336.1 GNAT family N-acetyltransferase [Rhizobium sp. L245/93]MBO9185288.1 GNAT family N-acetyltransferase [Rhizobium sp. E27B/91]QXZ85430.1 GNAT family N-acetyltransferase [Rhizobium sp. K1/93]
MATLDLTDAPLDGDMAVIMSGLMSFNASDVGPPERRSLAVFIRGDDGKVIGGLLGVTAWGWLFTQWLFVPEALRGQGMAGRLLAKAEAEALERGCHGAWIDTFNPHALRAYERQGYVAFGALADFPPGRSRTFLQKQLAVTS